MNLMDFNAYKEILISIYLVVEVAERIQKKTRPKKKFTELMKRKELRFPLNIDTVDNNSKAYKKSLLTSYTHQKKNHPQRFY